MLYPIAVLALVAFAGCGGGSSAPSAPPPPPDPGSWPQISLSRVAGGFVLPVHVAHAGDGTGRVFVVEQGGRIRILDNGAVLPDPFLDISAGVACCGEQGLLSVAFPPGFDSKRYFYVNYTRAGDGATVLARYRVSAGSPDTADPASEEILLTVSQPFANHNGGQIAFGPDGYLYIGMGDGGSGGDPQNNGQNPDVLLGKLLRIDTESGANPYAVPPDNPFAGIAGYRSEIWALGLRNPWRFAFDRATGDLYIGDVGQGAFEEVDVQEAGDPGGRNYGWNVLEGMECFLGPGCSPAGMTFPVTAYGHSLGCSITGGTVYRGPSLPLQGIYFYGDFCSGRIWGLRRAAAGWEGAEMFPPQNPSLNIATFGEDEAGNVYLADYGSGDLLKIVAR
jgi:glucose/arabinose dehydrogenase